MRRKWNQQYKGQKQSLVKASISQIIKSDGSVTNDDHEVVEVFNGFFQSVFIKEDPFSVPMVIPKVFCTLNEISSYN